MAIADGLATGCADLQASGGIQTVFIREWNKKADGTTAPDMIALAYDSTSTITSIADNTGSTSKWGVFETKLESPSLTCSGTTVGAVTTYECTLSMNFPNFSGERRTRITNLEGKCLQVMIKDTNGLYYVVGIGNVLTGGDGGLDIPAASHIGTRPQTFARLGTIEAGTGAAFSDENGIIVTLTSTQYELPRRYVPAGAAISIDSTGLIATVS